jgi:ankyrin repeat protein
MTHQLLKIPSLFHSLIILLYSIFILLTTTTSTTPDSSPSKKSLKIKEFLSQIKSPSPDLILLDDLIEDYPYVLNAQDPSHNMTGLLLAINDGKDQVVRFLLKKGANAMIEEKSHYYAWDIVAFNGVNLHIANALLDYKVDPNREHPTDGYRPIHRVCWGTSEGHAQILARLLSSKLVSANDVAADGTTPLVTAIRGVTKPYLPIITILLHAGADPSVLTEQEYKQFEIEIEDAKATLAKRKKPRPGSTTTTTTTDNDDQSSTTTTTTTTTTTDAVPPPLSSPQEDLTRGAMRNDVALLKSALQRGAFINHQEPTQGMQTALMIACLTGAQHAVRFLLEQKADVTVGEREGYTPFHGAGFQGQPEVAKILLEYQLDPNDYHKDGYTPFHRALWGQTPGHTAMVKLLLEKGKVDPNIKSKSGQTPFQILAQTSRNKNTAKILRDFNSDLSGLSESDVAQLLDEKPSVTKTTTSGIPGKPLPKDDPLRNDPLFKEFGDGVQEL